jgi:hypothetical protein
MEFDEKSLRKGIQFGLGSQGIWTPELEDVMFEEIKNQALSQHDVSGSVCLHESQYRTFNYESNIERCDKCGEITN